MNIAVLIVLVFILGGLIKGFRKGFVDELNSIVCLLLSLLSIGMFIVAVRGYLDHETMRTILGVVCLVVAVLVYKIVDFLLSSVKMVSKLPVMRGLDKFFGAVLGVAEVIAIIWATHIVLVAFSFNGISNTVLNEARKNPYLLMILEHNYLASFITKMASLFVTV